MSAIKLEQFGGMLPAWDPHLLPTGQGAYAQNTFLFSGSLIGWRKPKLLRTLLNGSARSVFRIPTISQSQAKAYLIFKSNPSNGDTAIVGELTYTFVNTLADPNDVKIGGSATTTATNFIEALTADDGQNTNAGTNYGSNTVANSDVYHTLPDTSPRPGMSDPSVSSTGVGVAALVGASDFGEAFNSITVGSTGTALTWLYDTVSLTHTTTTFYGGSNTSFDPSVTSASQWLEFTDPDTNVVKSPVNEDEWNRYYWASPSVLPQYNTYDRIASGSPSWLLGVPPPGCAPVVSVTGGGNNLTLGNSEVSTNPDLQVLGNEVILLPVTPDGSTQLQDVQFNLGTSGTADTDKTRWAAVLYADNGGAPGTLLNTGQVVTGITANGSENISVFLNPTSLIEGQQYWLGIIIDTQNLFAGGISDTYHFSAPFSNGPPATAPTASSQQGIQMWGDFITSDVLEARAYVYTWVSSYEEEGPPSPPTLLNGWSNGTWTIGLWQPPADDLGGLRDLTQVKIYRTVPGQGGQTVFFYVATVPMGTATYIDSAPDNIVALNDQLASTNWFPPPDNLQGLTVMQNGMIAGFTGTEIWFCEPYRPHAWPPGFVLTVDFPIVGLGFTSGALVVCTTVHPYVITGTSPDSLIMNKCALPNPCSSRGSILSTDEAVSYMSPNGLIQVNASGVATNTTDLWMTREKWQQLTPPKYARAIMLASCYFCLGSVSPPSVSPADDSLAQTGFVIELAQDNASFTIWPQPGGHRVGFSVLTAPTVEDVLNLQTDPWSGSGLLVANGKVYYWDFSDTNPDYMPYVWKSKVYQQNVKRNYSAMKVFFQAPTSTPEQTANPIEEVASDSAWNLPLPAGVYGFVKTYVDVDGTGNLTLIDCREIRKSGGLLRIVDGFKADQWMWEIDAVVNISNVQIATSPKELGSV